jgi:fatty acid desaturase
VVGAVMTLRHELHRMLTEPSRYVNPRVFAVVSIMWIIMAFGFVVAVSLGCWWPAAIYFVVGAVYTVLVYRHWPWRKS